MGVMSDNLPKRKKQAFEMILDLMADEPRVVILDEADILGPRLLESVRDLCKMARVPWVLVGEESLPMLMTKDRRVWSRNCASMEFSPMITSDICIFTKEATGLTMPPESADIIQRQTGGDVRLIELIIGMSETIARANNTKEITPEMAGKAIKKVIPEMKKRKQ
jgi:DNA transposition AAA+ family ATPase